MNTNNLHHDDDELKDAPILRSLRKSNGFDAPEGYFDRLTSDIQDRINPPTAIQTFNWKPIIAFASIAGIFIIVYFSYFKTVTPPAQDPQLAQVQISSDDLISTNYYTEFDEEILTEALVEPTSYEQQSTNGTQDMENYIIESSSEEELINAL